MFIEYHATSAAWKFVSIVAYLDAKVELKPNTEVPIRDMGVEAGRWFSFHPFHVPGADKQVRNDCVWRSPGGIFDCASSWKSRYRILWLIWVSNIFSNGFLSLTLLAQSSYAVWTGRSV